MGVFYYQLQNSHLYVTFIIITCLPLWSPFINIAMHLYLVLSAQQD